MAHPNFWSHSVAAKSLCLMTILAHKAIHCWVSQSHKIFTIFYRPSKLFFNCGKMHLTYNAPFYPFLRVQFSTVMYIHIGVQPISRTPSILHTWNSMLIKQHHPIPPTPPPLATTVLFAVSVNLTALRTACKRIIMFIFLCKQTFFTKVVSHQVHSQKAEDLETWTPWISM